MNGKVASAEKATYIFILALGILYSQAFYWPPNLYWLCQNLIKGYSTVNERKIILIIWFQNLLL